MGRLTLVVILLWSSTAMGQLRRDEVETLVTHGDGWTLLDQRLMNRLLFAQLERQPHRLLLGDRWTFAADVQTATQVPRHGTSLGAWHGHAIADLFGAVHVVDGLEVNLNLTAFNLGASYGYRATSDVLPGLGVHIWGHVGALRADLLATDLGAVTLGRGLMFEQLDLEGVMGRLRWTDLWLRLLIGGQLHTEQDDLFATTLGYGQLSMTWFLWAQEQFRFTANYLTLAGDVPGLGDTFRIAAEAAARLDDERGGVSGAALLRVDWLPTFGRSRLHLGYQARWYGAGFGPSGDALQYVTVRPAMVWREDTYATNAFDAWWPAPYYHQFWHTAMLEGLVSLGPRWLFARAELEYQWRLFDDPQTPPRRLPALRDPWDDDHWYPEADQRFWYRVGLEAQPFPGRPDRLRLWAVNKVAVVGYDPTTPTAMRLGMRKLLIAVELEVFL